MPGAPDDPPPSAGPPSAVDPSPLGSRSPTVAVVGVALAVLTVLALVALALWAVTRGDDEPSAPPSLPPLLSSLSVSSLPQGAAALVGRVAE